MRRVGASLASAASRALLPRLGAASCRPLCAAAGSSSSSSSSAPPRGVPVVLAQPPVSDRKQRIMEHGLIGLSAEFVRQQERGLYKGKQQQWAIQMYTVPLDRAAEFVLPRVWGFGRSRSKKLAAEVGVYGEFPIYRMRESQRDYIRRALNAACINFDDPENAAGPALQKDVGLSIQRLKDIGCYRGDRHKRKLPARGQRTKTNARTRRRMPY